MPLTRTAALLVAKPVTFSFSDLRANVLVVASN